MSISKNILKDDSGQVAGIIMFLSLVVVAGFLYVAFGGLVQSYVDRVNTDITNKAIPYSWEHMDAMDWLFTYWYFIPLIILGLGILYAIKNSLETETSEAY